MDARSLLDMPPERRRAHAARRGLGVARLEKYDKEAPG
jgi:hypothetical protein